MHFHASHSAIQWLPIKRRIEQNIPTLAFKVRSGLVPFYLSELLADFVPACACKSSDSPSLAVLILN